MSATRQTPGAGRVESGLRRTRAQRRTGIGQICRTRSAVDALAASIYVARTRVWDRQGSPRGGVRRVAPLRSRG